jgi:hypothetical protein
MNFMAEMWCRVRPTWCEDIEFADAASLRISLINYFAKTQPRAMVRHRKIGENSMADGELHTRSDDHRQPTGDLDVSINSPAIRRLIEEVRAETVDVPRSYNRTFNRHNR